MRTARKHGERGVEHACQVMRVVNTVAFVEMQHRWRSKVKNHTAVRGAGGGGLHYWGAGAFVHVAAVSSVCPYIVYSACTSEHVDHRVMGRVQRPHRSYLFDWSCRTRFLWRFLELNGSRCRGRARPCL